MFGPNLPRLSRQVAHLHLQAYFARVNWHAHLLPVIASAISQFEEELGPHNLQAPRHSVLSDSVRAGHLTDVQSEIWTDSVTFDFGARTIPSAAPARVNGSTRALIEDRACLVISQSLSGTVYALVYPPSSELMKATQSHYVVAWWRNPNQVWEGDVKKLLYLALETDLLCGSATFPNSRARKLLAKLQAKDAVLAKGRSRFWMWLQYSFHAAKGPMRLHGIGKPVLR